MTDYLALAERLDDKPPVEFVNDSGQYVAIRATGYNKLLRERKEAAAALREAHEHKQAAASLSADVTVLGQEVERLKVALYADGYYTLEQEVERLRALLREARAEVEFWTPDECNAKVSELTLLNGWYALRARIDAELKDKP